MPNNLFKMLNMLNNVYAEDMIGHCVDCMFLGLDIDHFTNTINGIYCIKGEHYPVGYADEYDCFQQRQEPVNNMKTEDKADDSKEKA